MERERLVRVSNEKMKSKTHLLVQDVLIVQFDRVDLLDHVLLEVAVYVENVLGNVQVGLLHVHGELCGGHAGRLLDHHFLHSVKGLFLVLFHHRLAVFL